MWWPVPVGAVRTAPRPSKLDGSDPVAGRSGWSNVELSGPAGLHQPRRPEWFCRRCYLPYPCPTARDRLVVIYGHTPALAQRAADLLFEAAPDLAGVPPADLFHRFIAWTAAAAR